MVPSELEKEQPYIARGIEFTRQAYGLDKFDERDFPAIQDLTAASIQQNAATMRNIRLWDHQPQLTTFQQLQEIRTYYDFAQVYNDRYTSIPNFARSRSRLANFPPTICRTRTG